MSILLSKEQRGLAQFILETSWEYSDRINRLEKLLAEMLEIDETNKGYGFLFDAVQNKMYNLDELLEKLERGEE